MKKTYKELVEANQLIKYLYSKFPEIEGTKFAYAWNKFHAKNIAPTFKELNEKLQDIHVAHALEDEVTHKIMFDKESVRGFGYSKSGVQEVLKAERTLQEEYNIKEIEIEPYISASIPETLTEEQIEELTGLILPNKEE